MKRDGKPKKLEAQKHKEKRQARKLMRKERRKRKEAQIRRLEKYQRKKKAESGSSEAAKGSGSPRHVTQSRED